MNWNEIEPIVNKVLNLGIPTAGFGITIHFFLNQQIKEGIICFCFTIILIVLVTSKKFLKKVWQQIEKRIMEDAIPLGDWIYEDIIKDSTIGIFQKLARVIKTVTSQLWWKLNSQFKRRYYESLIDSFRDYKIEGFRVGLPVLDLENVFVSLQVKRGILEKIDTGVISTSKNSQGNQIWDFLKKSKKKEFRAYRRLAVIAPPGSGKTTLLKYLTLTYAKKRYKKYQAPKFIPVLLYLREIRQLIISDNQPKLSELIKSQIETLPTSKPITTPINWIEAQLNIGNCLILLDGLDEVADTQERELVSQWVNRQMQVYRQTVFIVTSRPHGYLNNRIDEVGIVLEVLPFNSEQVNEFIHNWYLQTEIMSRAGRNTPAVELEAKNNAEDLINRIMENRAIANMAKNPLLVTMIATVHYCGSALPGRRVELYQKICDLLLDSRRKAKKIETTFNGEQAKSVLKVLALALMENETREFTLIEGKNIIKNELEKVAGNILTPQKFLKQIKEVSGLLIEKELGIYEFAHLSFQEYLAATQLKELQREDILIENIKKAWWSETIRLYAAQTDATNLIKEIIKNPTVNLLSLALDCYEERLKVDTAIKEELDKILEKGLESSDSQFARLAAGVKLSRRLNNFRKMDENSEIDRDYLTYAEYQIFVDEWLNSGELFPAGNGKKPVTGISWQDALSFCAWLSSKTEFNNNEGNDQVYYYRLPTSTEIQSYSIGKQPKHLSPKVWNWNFVENTEETKGIRLVKTTIPIHFFEYDVVTVNAQGKEIKRQRRQNQYFTENLGNDISLDMVAIPGGSFLMGTEDKEIERLTEKFGDRFKYESPQHKVTVSSFFISKYPITQRQWREIALRTDLKVKIDLNPEPSEFKHDPKSFAFPSIRGNLDLPAYGNNPSYLDRPVECISWNEAKEFCDRVTALCDRFSQLTAKKYRLPSEAEWEYVCRAVISYQSSIISEELRIKEWNQKYDQPFHFGETITSDLVNYDGTIIYAHEAEGLKRGETTPVGMFPPNGFGLYDMHGNVWEWCADNWHSNYRNAPIDGSAWIDDNRKKLDFVLRGGSWFVIPDYCRSAYRSLNFRRDFRTYYFGFRVVCGIGRTT